MENLNINLEYYKIFYYVGKLGNISKAAAELHISQPAVSQAIKQLEKQVETSLFIRTAKGVTLTREGNVLYSYVKQGYEYIVLGEQKFKEMQNLESGELVIGASDMTLQYFLLPYLEQYHMKYPKIKVSVTNAPTPETIANLSNGRIDFGIVSEPFEIGDDMIITPVKEIEDIFIAGAQFEKYKNKKLNFSDLEDMPIICLEQNTSTRRYVDEFLKTKQVELKPEFELATSDIIVQFALKNMGIGCVVENFAEEYIKDNKLFALKFKESIPKRRICIVTSKHIPISNAASKLLELL